MSCGGRSATTGRVIDEPWPAVDASALTQDSVEFVVQVNGKLRGRVRVVAGADEAAIREAALADEHVMKFVGSGAAVKRVIVVPGRQIVNVVVERAVGRAAGWLTAATRLRRVWLLGAAAAARGLRLSSRGQHAPAAGDPAPVHRRAGSSRATSCRACAARC